MKNLIIVESPNKVSTIHSLLKGTAYDGAVVVASVGHILEIGNGGKYCNCGIDPTNNFKAKYQIAEDKQEVVDKLKEQVRLADMVYLCSDPDREGESIAWSLLTFLDIPEGKYKRATFHEITKKAIVNGLDNATDIDYKLVDSADARRKIDKMLGYRLSPIGKRYVNARSIGRCQSAGLKLVVEREKEIQSFIPEEYWELFLLFTKMKQEYKAKYIGTTDKKLDKLKNKIEVEKIVKECEGNDFIVSDIIKKEKLSNTKPPFTTSTFQQEVSNKLGMSVKQAQSCAQKLFEGININGEHKGLITYIRTDSDTISEEFQVEIKNYIISNFGDSYLGTLKQGKKQENAQEAHEAIRVTDLNMTPEKLSNFIVDNNLIKVYNIIYKRTIASMMKPEVISETTYTIKNGNHLFSFVSKEQLFDGYKKVYLYDKEDKDDKVSKMTFSKDETITPVTMEDVQNFTKPKPRYKEATLIDKLESTGIGRPSTFVTIVTTITDESRGYCDIKDNCIVPTERGIKLAEFLDKSFPNLINVNYTSEMEKELDKIANGKLDEISFLKDFYDNLERNVEEVEKSSNFVKKQPTIAQDVVCPLCGKPMYIREGRYGQFYGCSGYPKCKGVVSIEKEGKSNS